MPKNHYDWYPGDQPPELSPHSIAKHEVLRAYLEKYVGILAASPFQEKLNLTLVDGFSGGGCYLHSTTKERLPGSPIIMLEAIRSAEIKANLERKKKLHVDAEFYFIDNKKPTIEYLNSELKTHEVANHYKNSINIICDDFSKQLDKIISCIQKRQRAGRAIFVLDQYGYTDIPLIHLRKIFQALPKAEVIMTIATDWLIDQWQDGVAKKLGLQLPTGILDQIKSDNPQDWRRAIQFHLHQQFFANSGAGFYTPFFVVSPKAHRCYWLLHFSAHPKARDVMMHLHWQHENRFEHYGGPAFHMLGYHPSYDNEKLGYQSLPFSFDSPAKEASEDALAIEIPKLISSWKTGISFENFFENVVNHTPATKEMLEKTIQKLTLEKELEIINDNGKRQNGVRIKDSDIIRLPTQTRFIFKN